ncbi:hypothetical protein BJ878DRAFT_575932 [Calycina marina]|uniref:Uncharacterized protein n=1 Tax=Calycina marina TaxID=1763456 RepID=A0A9P8CG81_9HELO|nr:hypothetical protein BJ878DRAFT_575932 [Calycina marina]
MNKKVPELPGFYYDKGKDRYFMIAQDGAGSSNYSASAVKERKVEDLRFDTMQRENARHEARIQRSKILQDPFLGGIMNRELGVPMTDLDMARVFSRGLMEQGKMIGSFEPSPFFYVDPQPKEESYSVYTSNCRGFACNRINTAVETSDEGRYPCMGRPMIPESNLTSMSANHFRGVIASTYMSNLSRAGISMMSMRAPGPIYGQGGVDRGPGLRQGDTVDMLCSTAAPPTSPILFAFGSSEGIVLADNSFDLQFYGTKPDHSSRGSKHDILALEFLRDNHSVLLAGGRNGTLHIVDLRIPEALNSIYHPGAITHIKQLDPHRILVAGLESSLLQYDLRFRKKMASVLPDGRRRSRRQTHPSMLYPGYRNEATIRAGLDLDLENRIIAAAGERRTKDDDLIQLFSLNTGELLKAPLGKCRRGLIRRGREATCIQFVKEENTNTSSLWFMCRHQERENPFLLSPFNNRARPIV